MNPTYHAMQGASQIAPVTNHPLSVTQPVPSVQPGRMEEDWEVLSEFLKEKRSEEQASNSLSMAVVQAGQSYHVGYAVSPKDEASVGIDELDALLSAVRLTSIDCVPGQTQGK